MASVKFDRIVKFFGEPDVPVNSDPNRIGLVMAFGAGLDGPFTLSLYASFGLPGIPACSLAFVRDLGTVAATPEDLGLK